MKPIKNIDDPRYVKAMSHPLRVRILAMLDERKASPHQLAGWLSASLGTVAYHVRTLEQLGLAELSTACDKLLEQAEKIEAAAAERIAKDPHADDVVEAGLGVMLFDAVRLSAAEQPDGRKPVTRRTKRSRRSAT